MAEPANTNPELVAAIIKIALIEAVLIAAGVVLFFVYDTIWGIVAAAVIGGTLMASVVIREAQRQKSNDQS